MSRHLRSRGVLLFVDGTQSVGALRFDVGAIRPDMLAVHGYKWLISPTGAGFMYVSPELRERLRPNVIGWRSHRDWRNVDNLHHGVPELSDSAEKYEGGAVSFPLLYAMEAAIDLILEVTWSQTMAALHYLSRMNDTCLDKGLLKKFARIGRRGAVKWDEAAFCGYYF